jgi:hypothetical protein
MLAFVLVASELVTSSCGYFSDGWGRQECVANSSFSRCFFCDSLVTILCSSHSVVSFLWSYEQMECANFLVPTICGVC